MQNWGKNRKKLHLPRLTGLWMRLCYTINFPGRDSIILLIFYSSNTLTSNTRLKNKFTKIKYTWSNTTMLTFHQQARILSLFSILTSSPHNLKVFSSKPFKTSTKLFSNYFYSIQDISENFRTLKAEIRQTQCNAEIELKTNIAST